MSSWQEITFTDQLLADGSVHRIYSNGLQEWRTRLPDRRVQWRDSTGWNGTDELLGEQMIKRSYADGRIIYGREHGYGRTAWSDGRLTINRTSFGGRVGALLTAAGAGVLMGAIVAPPSILSFEEEEEIRRRAAVSADGGGSGSSGDGGGGSSTSDDDERRQDGEWDDSDSDMGDGDFG